MPALAPITLVHPVLLVADL